MKFSEQWLRTWVEPTWSTAELVAQLTMAGLEVDSVEPVAPSFDKVVVGEVVNVAPHPNADKLTVCQVNIGTSELLTVVCGAPNVQANARFPTALIGAQLPNGFKIQKAKLRGVESSGMLCSADELGLTSIQEGLLRLPDDAPLGQALRTYLQLDDVSIEVDLTPNRGDCLSLAGIAREVGLLSRKNVNLPNTTAVSATITDRFPVVLDDSQGCPRYVGRVVKQVNIKAETPLWMQERLRRSGLRSINAVVDITNYVMLELGQPMHAFDLAQLHGSIHVRKARSGETLKLLDGQVISLDSQTVVIADETSVLAIAGVMGGELSGVAENTQAIFLESAFFSPQALAGCARRYGLQTDASYRFERGVDYQLQRRAMERATALLLDICGGEAGETIEVVAESALPTNVPLTLRASRIERLLGQSLPANEVIEILQRLGMTVTEQVSGQVWQVQSPSFRFDITQEADVIEELARIQGYDNLPCHAPRVGLTMQSQSLVTAEGLKNVLVQRGYQEAIVYSFTDPQLQALIDPEQPPIRLVNPISSDMAVMRTTLWTGLLQAVVHNQKRQQSRIRLFEMGLRFLHNGNQILQEKMLAGVVTGSRFPEQWGVPTQSVDFFDVKADVESLFSLTNGHTNLFKPAEHPALHPGQSAAIYQGDRCIGLLGALHPRLIHTLELTAPVYLFELQVAPLCAAQLPQFREISKFPSVRRDLALVVDQQLPVVTLLNAIRQQATELLVDLQLFDVYQGEGITSGKKSLAIGLIFQAFSRNLTELEVDTLINNLLSQLKHNFDAHLRT